MAAPSNSTLAWRGGSKSTRTNNRLETASTTRQRKIERPRVELAYGKTRTQCRLDNGDMKRCKGLGPCLVCPGTKGRHMTNREYALIVSRRSRHIKVRWTNARPKLIEGLCKLRSAKEGSSLPLAGDRFNSLAVACSDRS